MTSWIEVVVHVPVDPLGGRLDTVEGRKRQIVTRFLALEGMPCYHGHAMLVPNSSVNAR